MPDAESPVIPKREHSRELSLSSIESSPDIDGEVEGEGHVSPPPNAPVQKRKGGRKPIYATSEERKQRNRQAQAAFRERRTEYIKQLETTIKHQEETLQNLQQSHRSAADECLMLRYKNSLLERILLEKGIDVQAELKKKELSTSGKMPATTLPQQAPVHHRQQPSFGIGRGPPPHPHHAHRSSSGGSSYLARPGFLPNRSPQLQSAPATSSQGSSSPTAAARSPASSGFTGGINPPSGGFQAQPHPQQHLLPPPPPPSQQQAQQQRHSASSTSAFPPVPSASGPGLQAIAPYPTSHHSATHPPLQHPHHPHHQQPLLNDLRRIATGVAGGARPTHWPSPYRTHIEQLEQEYDAPDMLEDAEPAPDDADDDPDSVIVDAYPPPTQPPQQQGVFGAPMPPHQQQRVAIDHAGPSGPHQGGQGQRGLMPQPGGVSGSPMDVTQPAVGPDGQLFDPYDPMLDADPFGLTASMHFPSPFTFQESSMRK